MRRRRLRCPRIRKSSAGSSADGPSGPIRTRRSNGSGRWRNRTDAIFSIDAAGHEQRVGLLRVLFGLVDPFGFAELGYSLLPEGRGRGYATRAVRLAADWVFDELGIGRLQARTAVDNMASARVLERAGFQPEGIARAGWVLPVTGERRDVTMWSLLPSDREWAEPDIAQTRG